MISAVHTLIYSDDASATRAFLRDVVGFPFVDSEGADSTEESSWLIFGTGPSEMGVHPTADDRGGEPWSTTPHHEISLMCDDVAATRAELESRGATFQGDIADHGYGLVTMLEVPGTVPIQLYQPRHVTAY